MQEEAYTVSQLTHHIANCLEEKFFEVWVKGEVSDLRIPSSGHMYFILKDSTSQLKSVLFKGQQRSLSFIPQDGQMVLVRGGISVYAKRGDYQLIIEYLEPLGTGALQRAFEELKKKLEREGLFSLERKRPLPFWPKKIGIVTSPTGAAIQDIINIITKRFTNIQILINPVRVQGEGAAYEISEAINELQQYPEVEVIIVTRGGGSLEDLWAFNEEIVARAIYNSSKPIISAVGHEIDFTISDFVADMRAPTPSAAAELVIKNQTDIEQRLDRLEMSLVRICKEYVNKLKQKTAYLDKILMQSNPKKRISFMRNNLMNYTRRLIDLQIYIVKDKRHSFSALQAQLESLSPLSILKRGYSICRKEVNNIIIKDARELAIGDYVTLQFFKGETRCEVKKDTHKS
ncbi:MAG: exodeoxyribonuclease VII large subunit [bacterium]